MFARESMPPDPVETGVAAAALSLGGIGPRLALVCLPYILLSVLVMLRYPGFGSLDFLDAPWARASGFVLMGIGVLFWVCSAFVFLRNFRSHRLITAGPFALCRNPIYSAIILFIIPSLALILHSGLVLSMAVVLYIGFRVSIHGETLVLARTFGDEYARYCRSVNEFFPFPRRRREALHG